MWKLTPASKELKKWYTSVMLNGLYNRIKKLNSKNPLAIENVIREILIPKTHKKKDDKSILRRLLTNKPKSLYKLCDSLMKKIITGYDDNEFNDYLKAKKAKIRTPKEESLYKKYHDALNLLYKVFDHDGQISQNKQRAYELTSEQGHNTCTYCNRQYIFTVIKDDLGNSVAKQVVRPELDHWFSKELYPLMSLSLYNLIPSCSICNKAKGNEIFGFGTHIHPYLDETPNEPKFEFRCRLKDISHYEVVIDKTNVKVERMLSAFKLEEIYCYHGELEAKDILQYGYQNSDAYLNHLLNDLLKHYRISKEDAYRMFFGTELKAKNDLNRPLSKLKRDILKQIGLLKNGELEW